MGTVGSCRSESTRNKRVSRQLSKITPSLLCSVRRVAGQCFGCACCNVNSRMLCFAAVAVFNGAYNQSSWKPQHFEGAMARDCPRRQLSDVPQMKGACKLQYRQSSHRHSIRTQPISTHSRHHCRPCRSKHYRPSSHSHDRTSQQQKNIFAGGTSKPKSAEPQVQQRPM